MFVTGSAGGGGETEYPHITLAAMFDSTAFGSQSWVTVRFRAVDNYNRLYEDSNSSQNKNLAFCFGHPDFWYWPTNGQVVASDNLNAMGYFTAGPIEGDWTNQQFANCLRVPVVYVNSHGDGSTITAGNFPAYEPDDMDPYVVWFGFNGPSSVDVETSRTFWNSTGIPPFNDPVSQFPEYGSNPPVNLTFLETCNGGDYGSFLTFNVPYTNLYVYPMLENQAVHAYTVYTRAIDSCDMAYVLFGWLAEGYTIQVASTTLQYTSGISCKDEESDWWWRPMNLPTDRVIHGDPFARLSTVYDPTTHNPTGFSRPL